MDPIERLKQEHQLQLLVLAYAQREIRHIAAMSLVRTDQVEKLLVFFDMFVERYHHLKEERYLFPLLKRHGLPSNTGPLARAIEEYREIRKLKYRMARSLPSCKRGNRPAMDILRSCLGEYVFLLRSHIRREDEVLYTIAPHLLGADDFRLLAKAYDSIETRQVDSGALDRYYQLADDLKSSVA